MNGRMTIRRSRVAVIALAVPALGIWLLPGVPAARADAIAAGSAQISNIQYSLVNPADGTINWTFDDGFGGPAWQGEAWVEVSDSLGGAGADYNITADGTGLINAYADTPLAWGLAWDNVLTETLYGESEATIPVGQWSTAAELATMHDYYSISPTVPGSTDPVGMAFSFDYQIHLTGLADPLGAPYYSDASASMLLEVEDGLGNWQPVPGGQLQRAEFISGSGTDTDDVTFSGQLQTIVWLQPEVMYAVEYSVYLNETDIIPEPAMFGLLLAGSLIAFHRRRSAQR